MADTPAPQSTTGAGHATTSSSNTAPDTSSASAHPQPAVEMSVLDASKRTTGAGSQGGLLSDVEIPESSPISTSFPSGTTTQMPGIENARPGAGDITNSAAGPSSGTVDKEISSADATPPPPITRLDSVAIGPARDQLVGSEEAPITPVVGAGPVLAITLLLHTGARHPYKIDERYLAKRGVDVPSQTEAGKPDPYSISVYTLKELILREWRDEWEPRPSSPSSIRLIFFGRLLDDKTPLRGKLSLLFRYFEIYLRAITNPC